MNMQRAGERAGGAGRANSGKVQPGGCGAGLGPLGAAGAGGSPSR